jgi:hypothetical protein
MTACVYIYFEMFKKVFLLFLWKSLKILSDFPKRCLCPTRLSCTSEEKKKVFYYHMIYSPETDHQIRHCSRLQLLKLNDELMWHNDTYSVHNEVLMSHRARLVVLLAPPWASCHPHCCGLTAYLTLHWVGQVPPPHPHSWWPHFPQGPCTPSSPVRYSASAVTKKFPISGSTHHNGFQKPLETLWSNRWTIFNSSVLWVVDAFRNSFVTATAAF